MLALRLRPAQHSCIDHSEDDVSDGLNVEVESLQSCCIGLPLPREGTDSVIWAEHRAATKLACRRESRGPGRPRPGTVCLMSRLFSQSEGMTYLFRRHGPEHLLQEKIDILAVLSGTD
jgi:hypothetical protein